MLRMHQFVGRFVGTLIFTVGFLASGMPVLQGATLSTSGLMGVVKSSNGKPLEGVTVSARAANATVTTSVYTNAAGEYLFPELADGQYRVWAQAVGFQLARSEQSISANRKVQQNFALKPLADFHRQLSSVEWANSLPSDSAEDRRMNVALNQMCTTCHITGFLLSKRFDAAGWGLMIDYMLKTQLGRDPEAGKLVQAYKDDLVAYLTRVRGPNPSPMKFKPLARPAGDAAAVVVTEYDLPRGDDPNYVFSQSGSDWSEGIPSRFEMEETHDAVVGKDGNVWFTDFVTPERTLGKLDPKTGHITGYKLADKDGLAVRTHGIISDHKGNLWLTNGSEGTMLKFDPKTEKFQRFPKPDNLSKGVGGMIQVDSKGNLWTTQSNGAFRLNPETGEYTEYKSVTPGGEPYGITIDAEDNAWFAQLQADKVGFVDGRTGKIGEVATPPVDEEVNPKDREIAERTEKINNVPVIYQGGPRRLGADRRGDAVWVAEYYAGKLAKIDIHTKKLTEYRLPNRYSHPYSAVVDKNHMVWINLQNADRIAKFDPFTEKFTEYPLPSLGSDSRFIDVDDSTDPPTVWIPYIRINKIARVQFRTASPAK